MMKEWARACYVGEATVTQPPNIEIFDPAKRQAVLNPIRQAMTAASTPSLVPSTGGLAELTSFLNTARQWVHAVPGTPATPVTLTNRGIPPPSAASPTINTPSKLSRFLKYAEDTLGISNASIYETALQHEGYGPDILHLVDDKSLTSLGISMGDALRLKTGCVASWKGPDAKRKYCDSDDPFQSGSRHGGDLTRTPPNKKVRFETKYAEGGSFTFFGPRIIATDPDGPEPVDVTWYYCEARQGMFPIPRGFIAVPEGAGEEEFPMW